MRDRLYRSRRDRVIGGLAAGMGRSLGIDPNWVRLGWLILAGATQGLAIVIYIALLFVIPEAPDHVEPPEGATTDAGGARTFAGAGDPAEAGRTPAGSPPPPTPPRPATGIQLGNEGSRNAALIVGLVLVLAGAWLLLRRYISIDLELGWPVVAIGIGLLLVLASLRSGRSS
jgi:phage shock protein C